MKNGRVHNMHSFIFCFQNDRSGNYDRLFTAIFIGGGSDPLFF